MLYILVDMFIKTSAPNSMQIIILWVVSSIVLFIEDMIIFIFFCF